MKSTLIKLLLFLLKKLGWKENCIPPPVIKSRNKLMPVNVSNLYTLKATREEILKHFESSVSNIIMEIIPKIIKYERTQDGNLYVSLRFFVEDYGSTERYY